MVKNKMTNFVHIKALTDQIKKKIETELIIQTDQQTHHKSEKIELFDLEFERVNGKGNLIHLPFAWARSNGIVPTPEPSGLENKDSVEFLGTLRQSQKIVRQAALKTLDIYGSTIIAAQPGFGKTIITVELICTLNVPTVIFVKQTVICLQWLDCLKTYAPHKKVCKINSTKMIDTKSDVYLINPILFKKSNNDVFFRFNRLEAMRRIRFVVVDELHQIVSKILHRAFYKVSPDYLLGLSATPYRPTNDAMKPAVSLFFGQNVIKTPIRRKHTVYVVKTGFTPKIKINMYTKKLDWNTVLNSQATDEDRNKKIVQCIMLFPDKTWLVLVKRVEHARLLGELIAEQGLRASLLVGTTTTFDANTKILIGTTCKVGTGFDHTLINGLVVATDCVEYFEQFLGRCMRRPDVEPVVLDFEDMFRPLSNHLAHRLEQYKLHGGVIIKCKLDTHNNKLLHTNNTNFAEDTHHLSDTNPERVTNSGQNIIIPARHKTFTESL